MKLKQIGLVALVLGGMLLVHADPAEARGLRRCGPECCPPPPPVTVVLQVCHPCTGCKYDVVVCVPACCAKEPPSVCYQNTLIGHGRTVFEWNNGHTVIVRYPPSGGYRVIQRG